MFSFYAVHEHSQGKGYGDLGLCRVPCAGSMRELGFESSTGMFEYPLNGRLASHCPTRDVEKTSVAHLIFLLQCANNCFKIIEKSTYFYH